MARARIRVDEGEIREAARRSPALNRYTRDTAQEIAIKARAVFAARQILSNEHRLSETTPPKYIRQFRLERIDTVRNFSWRVINTDPAAVWVEYGAHAGGRTFVLRYYPLKTALRAQGMAN